MVFSNSTRILIKSTKNGKQISHTVEMPEEKQKGEEKIQVLTDSFPSVDQFVARFYSGQLVIERIIREGCGYATTEREKKIADAKQKENEEKMSTLLSKSVKKAEEKFKSNSNTAQESSPSHPPPNQELLQSINSFGKDKLKPTQTIEKHSPVINGGPKPGYGHSTEDEIKEYFDSEEELNLKIKELVSIIKNSKYIVAYTGAGISTSAKIPDYRGPNGVWTLRDRGEIPKFEITMRQALPTVGHMALLSLLNKGILKYIISTNVDGLHRRSGVPVGKLAELHGNCYKEFCANCGKEYLRDFEIHCNGVGNHVTGRFCEEKSCQGLLMDSIIHFGENLPKKELTNCIIEAQKSDLSLVLGTSMRVTPACLFPLKALSNDGKMVIINLQRTPCNNNFYSKISFF